MRLLLCLCLLVLFGCSDSSADTDVEIADTDVKIDGLGEFKPQRLKPGGVLYCYLKEARFRGQTVELIIYPNDDGTEPGTEARKKLKRVFERFDDRIDDTLLDLPSKLRSLCTYCSIDVEHLTDEQIIAKIEWRNIKLAHNGTIECYLLNELVTSSLDIVVGFTEQIEIEYVHFDG